MDPMDKTSPDDREPAETEVVPDDVAPADKVTPDQDEEDKEEKEEKEEEEEEEEIFPWRAYEEESPVDRAEGSGEGPGPDLAQEPSMVKDFLAGGRDFVRKKFKWTLAGLALILLLFLAISFFRNRQVLTQPIQVEEAWKKKILKGNTLYYLEGTGIVAREGGQERFRVALGKQVNDLAYGPMIYALADGKIKVLDMDSGETVHEKEEAKALWLQPLEDGGVAVALPDRVLLLDRNLEVREVQEARSIPYAFYKTAMGTARLDGGPIQKDLVVQGQVEWDVGIAPYPPEDRTLSFLAIHEEGRPDILLPSRRPLLDVKEGPKGAWLVLSADRLLVIREGAMVRSIPFTRVRDWAIGDKLAILDGAKVRLIDMENWEVQDRPLDFIPGQLATFQGQIYALGEGKLARLNGDLKEGKLVLKKGISQPIIQNLDGAPAAVTDQGLVPLNRVDLGQEEKIPEKTQEK